MTNFESHEPSDAALERLSALVDGELGAQAVASACDNWRESAESRASWHAYQLIGDVLRSDDLASDPASDMRFIEAFRARLATEPVVLAPKPLVATSAGNPRYASASAASSGSRSWRMPSALAASFAVVAGVLFMARGPAEVSNERASTDVATAPASTPQNAAVQLTAAPAAVATPAVSTELETFVANGKLIRDARLDRYLAAHKQFAGSSALGVPSAFLRNATADATDR